MCSLHNLSFFFVGILCFLCCFFFVVCFKAFLWFFLDFYAKFSIMEFLTNFFVSEKFHPQTSIIYLTIYKYCHAKQKLTREKVKIKMSLNQSRSDWLVANFLISNLTQFYGRVKWLPINPKFFSLVRVLIDSFKCRLTSLNILID